MIAPSDSEARAAVLRIDAARDPKAVIRDARNVIRHLAGELESWQDAPHAAALISVETGCEGLRRLLGELRLASRQQRETASGR